MACLHFSHFTQINVSRSLYSTVKFSGFLNTVLISDHLYFSGTPLAVTPICLFMRLRCALSMLMTSTLGRQVQCTQRASARYNGTTHVTTVRVAHVHVEFETKWELLEFGSRMLHTTFITVNYNLKPSEHEAVLTLTVL